MSLGILLAFLVDTIIGVKQFNLIAVASIVLTLLGVFILADVKLRIKSLQKDLMIRIICDVAMGYMAHFILQYWSNAFYMLVLNLLLTLIFSKGYTISYHKKGKQIIKWVFIQQTFGFIATYLGNHLTTNSVTLSAYTKPVSIVLTILIAYFMKNTIKKPKVIDLFAVFLVTLGVALINQSF